MFGKNKILKPDNHSGESLDIVEIFPTLQGEGPYAGRPAVFVRLGGCNLACEFCDTEFEKYQNLSVDNISQEVSSLAKNNDGEIVRNLVVITGGEPLRQPIETLCRKLQGLNFLVQIETNGTLFRDLPEGVKVICSPKITNGKYHKIRPDLLNKIDALKFIISKGDKSYYHVGDVGQSDLQIPIYLQPMDEYDKIKNKANLHYAAQLCQDKGHLLSVQIHKILKIR